MLALLLSALLLTGQPRIIDGDTIAIAGQRVRLLDIDAPELHQTCGAWHCGKAAKQMLAELIAGHEVKCEGDKRDKYRRLLAYCSVNGMDLSVTMASMGYAVPYRNCGCPDVRGAAAMAKEWRIGIWAGSFEEPWVWRKQH